MNYIIEMDVRHFECFAELVRAIRRSYGLSQRALAKRLEVSPGYIGQWELRLSQPSTDVALKLCRLFSIEDIEYVQRLAYAQRAPDWLRESIVMYRRDSDTPMTLTPTEQRVIDTLRQLPPDHAERLAERIEGWVDAMLGDK
jgi:transcriptional regulator with XRE-family HTH domain